MIQLREQLISRHFERERKLTEIRMILLGRITAWSLVFFPLFVLSFLITFNPRWFLYTSLSIDFGCEHNKRGTKEKIEGTQFKRYSWTEDVGVQWNHRGTSRKLFPKLPSDSLCERYSSKSDNHSETHHSLQCFTSTFLCRRSDRGGTRTVSEILEIKYSISFYIME